MPHLCSFLDYLEDGRGKTVNMVTGTTSMFHPVYAVELSESDSHQSTEIEILKLKTSYISKKPRKYQRRAIQLTLLL